ncbi:hypothetical protein BC748_0802 [Flavobacterium dankookense]|uniref:Uncharacterized protein n=1 Tax=Flavobacterium dankookense TaxID=706186 RepID=A0A4R6QEN1_9FLAO|nr:hypothetical protein BC748_0802 [Flavobacterium dankookense]
MIFRIFNEKKHNFKQVFKSGNGFNGGGTFREMKIMVIFKNKNSYDYFIK